MDDACFNPGAASVAGPSGRIRFDLALKHYINNVDYIKNVEWKRGQEANAKLENAMRELAEIINGNDDFTEEPNNTCQCS